MSADKFDATNDERTPQQRAESLAYKFQIASELFEAMKDKYREKEPRRDWREHPLPLRTILSWLLAEVGELVEAAPEDAFREAADVANLAAIYADVVRRRGAGVV